MAVCESQARCRRRQSQRRKVMWQSVPVLSVQHPDTAKSYGPIKEKYFDNQQFYGREQTHHFYKEKTRFGGCRAL
jgi:hypothetical protein